MTSCRSTIAWSPSSTIPIYIFAQLYFRRDIRHLDNHLDRIEENLHTMMLLLKKSMSDKGKTSAESNISDGSPIIANIRANYVGYLSLLAAQAVLTVLLITVTRGRKAPQRKAL